MDAIQVGEHSFTEWGIQYWPVKLTMPIGAALLLLQGVSKLIKDIMIVTQQGGLTMGLEIGIGWLTRPAVRLARRCC